MVFRRIAAVFLAILFIVIFIPLLLVSRVNDTALNPEFYVSQLRQADTYNFLYDKVLPAAVDQAFSKNDDSAIDISALNTHAVSALEQAVPRQWLQTQVETSMRSILSYTFGDTASFKIQIPLKDRVQAASLAVKNTLQQADVSSSLYNQIIDLMINQAPANINGVSISQYQYRKLITSVVPQEWLIAQLTGAIDNITPYLTGDQDHFTVRIDLKSRLDAAQPAIITILQDPQFYNYFVEQAIAPAIEQKIQSINQVSSLAIFTNDDIANIAKTVFPVSWYQAQVPSLTTQFIAYLKGNQTTLSLTIPLSDRKPAAITALSDLINKKVGTDISVISGPILNKYVNQFIPDQYVLDESVLGSGISSTLTSAHKLINSGITYTDADLGQSLGFSQNLADIRQKIAGGLVFTDQDLRHLISNSENNASGNQIRTFDNVRNALGTERRWMWVVWLIPALILIAIGALGARRWQYKLVWGASVLAISSLIVYFIAGPVFSNLVQPKLTDTFTQIVKQSQGLQALITGKATAMAQNSIDAFIRGLEIQTLILLVISILVIVFGIIWPKIKGTKTDSDKP